MDPKIEDEMYSAAVKLIYVFDRIDYLDSLAEQVKPTVLIFLPGIYEISCMHKQFEESTRMLQRENDFIVIILHSLITQEEQTKVLRKPTYGKRLIILSTNIAESSITVPDVKFVIDFCLTKTLVTDTNTNFSSLQLEWCSRSNCRQRAGRTGRTMDGRVYRLVPQLFYTHQMEEMSKPEMCRSPLEMVVLKAKQLDIGPPINIISMAMDVPTLSDFKNTILLLKEAGALLRTCNGKHSDDDGDITFIGIVMAALPVNIRVAKLIVIGHCFSVLSDCIIMGAGLTTKTIFVQGYKNAVTFYSKKLVWSDGSGSDLLAILKAYKSFESRKKEFGNTKNWTERYFLNEKSLMEMTNLIDELTERLSRLGIKERSGANRATWSHAEKSIILKVVIAGAFYPNYFVRSSSELEGRSAYHELNGRNPCNTVFFSGFPERFIRPLYIQSIKKRLMVCTNSPDNMRVAFDEGNEKVFVTFKQTRSSVAANTDPQLNFIEMGPGQVCIEVYKAIKLRMTSSSIHLNVMHPVDAQKYAEEHKLGAIVRGKWQSNKKTIKNIEMVCLPRKHVKSVTGQITHYDSTFNRFWFRPAEEDGLFYEIQSELNSLNRDIEPFSNYGDIYVEQVVAAAYDGNFYRAKVLAIIHGSEDIYFTVVLLDLGLEGEVEFSELRRLRGVSAKYIDIPPRVFECRLASLQPSELQSERYGWGSTMAEFKKLTEKTTVTAEIYSVDSGVASVFIRIHDCTVQEILIDSGFCRTADEDFMSKLDHDLRVKTQASNSSRFEDECDAIADEIRRMLPAEEEYE
ncbi:putative ATP-dependent RNA helicase spindle-E, partial [Pseudolycoriella hygida]